MHKLITVPLFGLALALAACTEAERRDTGNDVEAAAEKVGQEAREAVSSPELKELGSEIKDAAQDAGNVIEGAAKGAAEGGREAAAQVEGEVRDETGDAQRAAEDARR